MKARNELNALLYRKKMDAFVLTEPTSQRAIFAAIVVGEVEKIQAQCKNNAASLLSDDRILSKNALKNTTYHFILAASAIADTCIENGMGKTEADTLSDLYIRKADECKTADGILRLYEDMCVDFAERMQEIRKETVISLHIRKCIDYIYENLGADLSIGALATVVGLNATYLSRLFRREVGISLKQFVKEARVDTAKNLLCYTNLSYLVISTSLGFSTQSAFIAVFKAIAGVTPKTYRDTHRKKDFEAR